MPLIFDAISLEQDAGLMKARPSLQRIDHRLPVTFAVVEPGVFFPARLIVLQSTLGQQPV